MLDEPVVYVASHKQQSIMKSPTEAELVGLTDNLGLIVGGVTRTKHLIVRIHLAK
jgi:hypothetical protein